MTIALAVALIGLGAGTLAAYGARGDFFKFYEINPEVIRAAAEYFHFLGDSAAATQVVPGDGRLMLEREPRGLGMGAVQDCGNLAGMTQAAARTFALIITRFRADFESDTHLNAP